MKATAVQAEQQPAAVIIHDLRGGKSSRDIRVGDVVITESGAWCVKDDGAKGQRLYWIGEKV